MLLSSLTAAALASATVARTQAKEGLASLGRTQSESTATRDLRPRSTPPIEMTEMVEEGLRGGLGAMPSTSTTSLSSVNSQDSQNGSGRNRQQLLEDRHQELLRKQKLLQEQYSRLQQLSRGQIPKGLDLKKTGSESDIMSKSMGAANSASLTQLGNAKQVPTNNNNNNNQIGTKIGSHAHTHAHAQLKVNGKSPAPQPPNMPTSAAPKHVETQKIYETDIL